MILLTLTFGYTHYFSSIHAVAPLKDLSTFPAQIGDFTLVSTEDFSSDVLGNLGVDHYFMRLYRDNAGYAIWVYLGYYEDQSEGAIIHSPLHCYPGSGWEPADRSRIGTPGIAGANSQINRLFLQKAGTGKQLVHYWYQGRGRIIADEYRDRFFMILDSVLRRRSDGALVRISGDADNLQAAEQKQMAFLESLLPITIDYIPE